MEHVLEEIFISGFVLFANSPIELQMADVKFVFERLQSIQNTNAELLHGGLQLAHLCNNGYKSITETPIVLLSLVLFSSTTANKLLPIKI